MQATVFSVRVEENELLANIVAAPDDDGPRLVFADWLSERGDPRGEFISLQLKLAHADEHDERLVGRPRIENRIEELLNAHAKTWTAELFAGLPAAFSFEFPRGFVDHIAVSNAAVGGHLSTLFARAPLLRSGTFASSALTGLLQYANTMRFERLRFAGLEVDELLLQRLAVGCGALRSIDFDNPSLIGNAAMAIAEWPVAVTHLGLAMTRRSWMPQAGADFLERLAATPVRRSLRSLRLEGVNLDRCAPPEGLSALERLELVGCRLGRSPSTLTHVFACLPQLTSLAVATDGVSTAEVVSLVESCPRLRRVRLNDVGLTSAGAIEALARLPDLRRLDLARNRLGQSSLRHLMRAQLPHIASIVLPMHLVDANAKHLLRTRFPGADVAAR